MLDAMTKILGFKKDFVPVTQDDVARSYHRQPSLLKGRLPWVDYDPKSHCFLLEDGRSIGTIFELSDVSCEAKPEQFLLELRDKFQRLFQDTIPQESDSPWIVQFYLQDDLSLANYIKSLENYIRPAAKGTAYTDYYLDVFKKHCEFIANPEGLFQDREVSGNIFRGKRRRIRMVIYRRIPLKTKGRQKRSALQNMRAIAKSVANQMKSAGIHFKRYSGKEFYEWMVTWFNPKPAYGNGNPDILLENHPYPDSDNKPFGYDFAEQIFFNSPQSDAEQGFWYFDDMPHRFVTVDSLSMIPSIGHISGERNQGGKFFALFDKFPEGSIFVMTVVIEHQEKVKNHIEEIDESSAGENVESALTRADCQMAREEIAKGNYLFPTVMGAYIRGKDDADLLDKEMDVEMLLNNSGFKVIRGEFDLSALDAYLRYLPMCYDYAFDKAYTKRSRFIFGRQLANLVPLYGRCRGTGHPGMPFWNRAGEAFTFDILSRLDKSFNSHLLFLGATGAGKSATLVTILMHVMAIYRPRLFIVEAGNSFGLLCDFFQRHGLSVNQVTLKASQPTPLNPFADGLRILDKLNETYIQKVEAELEETIDSLDKHSETLSSDDDEINAERDYLGEMALMCQLMITGGEKKEEERITRQDRQVIIEAIIDAVKHVHASGGKEVIAENIVEAFFRLSEQFNQKGDTQKAMRTREMADGMKLFCTDPTLSSFFNRKGQPWPMNDVTRLDMGLMKDEGYEAPLALAYMGMMTRISSIAEATQYDDRMTIVVTDESHVITKNPLTAASNTKTSKMSRKFGLWLWFATQNVSDFPDEARKILSMIEFWICLGTSEEEIKDIKRFKTITEEQHVLFGSVKKEIPNYVEGVVLGSKVKGLFRSIPPRLALSLGMTEKEEKAARNKLMKEFNISEVEAAEKIGEQMMASVHVEESI